MLPLYVPVRDGGEITGLVDLMVGPTDGGADHADLRGALIEGIIEESEDETLMDRYLGGEEISHDTLTKDLEKAVAHATLPPGRPRLLGVRRRLRRAARPRRRRLPVPARARLARGVHPGGGGGRADHAATRGGPLVAEVVKTTSDQYVGRVSLVRVFSGTLTPDAPVHVSGHFTSFFCLDSPGSTHEDHDEDEKIGSLTYPFGRQHVPAEAVIAGDLAAIGKLSRAETGDTLSSIEEPRVLRPWSMPEPLLPVAIVAKSKADEDKLSQALGRLAAEDPSVRVENNPETHQLVLWTMGEAHADVLIARLADRYSVHVETEPFLVSLRETFGGQGKGLGRHVKQSGGHGQYAVCHIEVEPLPEGGGFEFVDKVVGGAVPRQFIPSVEKGVRAQMERGVRAGYPMVDLRVTLTDGKAHAVDSSDMAFQMAGSLALREAAAAANVTMLEPYDVVAVVVPDDQIGATMSDLSSRRARLLGTDKIGDDRTRDQRRGAADRAGPLRRRPALVHPRRRLLHPLVRPLRADARGRRPLRRRPRAVRRCRLPGSPVSR